MGLIPGRGTKIPCAVQCHQKIKNRKLKIQLKINISVRRMLGDELCRFMQEGSIGVLG